MRDESRAAEELAAAERVLRMSFAVRPRTFGVLGLLVWAFVASSTSAQDGVGTQAEVPAAASGTSESEPKIAWDLLHRRYNTWSGITGGMSIVDAASGEPGSVRIQLGLDGYSGSDYLRTGDEIDYRSQTLSLSVTALPFLELFGTLGNRSLIQSQPENRSLDSFGDFMF